MAYAQYLRDILRPMRLYELGEGLGAAELEVLGAALDSVVAGLEVLERESQILSAEEYGLTRYGEILPYYPGGNSLRQTRLALGALIRIDGRSFTEDALNETLIGCGIPAAVMETGEYMTVEVSFPGIRGIPENFGSIMERIETVLPCHLQIRYHFDYLRWMDLEAEYLNWLEVEAAGSWYVLETAARTDNR